MTAHKYIDSADIENVIESCIALSKKQGMDRDRASFINEVQFGMRRDGFELEDGRHTDEIWLRLKELEGVLEQDAEDLAVVAKGYPPEGEVAIHAGIFVSMLNEAAGIATPARAIKAAEFLVEQYDGEVEPARIHAMLKVMVNVLSDVKFLLSDEGQDGDPLRMSSLFMSQESDIAV